LVGVCCGCGCGFVPFRSQYSHPHLSTRIPISQTFFKSLSPIPHFPTSHSTHSVFSPKDSIPHRLGGGSKRGIGLRLVGVCCGCAFDHSFPQYSHPHFSTQILFPQTFFKSLSSIPHFPNPHPTDSASYPKDFIRSSFEYSDPQILI
jgi:hypothetical protein